MFDQPELEAILRANLSRSDIATVRGATEVTALAQDEHGVRVEFTDLGTGSRHAIRAEYVLGCDGAGGLTRTAIGATPFPCTPAPHASFTCGSEKLHGRPVEWARERPTSEKGGLARLTQPAVARKA
jgi:2-polyprenyl-6-methoxyphenol hydroxylase-like FAD-dependent oxidoreductase